MEDRQLMTTLMLINGVTTVEGTGSNHQAAFTVNLSAPSNVPVTVQYNTSNRTAMAGTDYVATSGTLTFNPGEVTKKIPVTVIGDSQIELTEAFSMVLSSPKNAMLISSQGVASIIDDDTPVASALSINDVSIYRGLNGSKTMLFTVGLNAASTANINVTVATSNVTAIAGADYQAKSQVLTFAPGETSKQFAVTIYGTSVACSDKIFYVNLSNASVAISRTTSGGILKYGA